jgi:hypothetical protein
MIKYTPQFLKKVEEIFEENGYKVRYEKGNFKSGYCLIEDRKMVIVNKFASIESRINTLLDILKVITVSQEFTGEKFQQLNKQLLKQQKENELSGELFSEEGSTANTLEELPE